MRGRLIQLGRLHEATRDRCDHILNDR